MTTKAQLQAEAAALGLSTDGTKATLQARIDAYLEASIDTAAALNAEPELEPASRRPRDTAAAPFLGLAVGISALFGK